VSRHPVRTSAALPVPWIMAVAAAAQGPAAAAPKLWVNYDFVPGSRVIFFTDYVEDQVGNFPKRLEHGVDAARLTAKGLGSTKPATPNTTAEARQTNRRVELVKI
jgi:hypothetical protein